MDLKFYRMWILLFGLKTFYIKWDICLKISIRIWISKIYDYMPIWTLNINYYIWSWYFDLQKQNIKCLLCIILYEKEMSLGWYWMRLRVRAHIWSLKRTDKHHVEYYNSLRDSHRAGEYKAYSYYSFTNGMVKPNRILIINI